ncbi:DNA repair protein RecO [Paraflavitalea speifideaquila]|uniref:DNA repair protein RecO n=1 Tax=Paraflavitalea speifideaquila TaxID=3076558 RepID=UPI0028EA63FE|nr:recombination protein O N-terminal domain-containing protein [Paraflavitalea speifideiaquila]
MIHSTKGVVLKTVKYGETSVIVTIYTELFGIQSYLVNGVRTSTKKGRARPIYSSHRPSWTWLFITMT